MAVLSIESELTVDLREGSYVSYLAAQGADSAGYMSAAGEIIITGQRRSAAPHWLVYRGAIRFGLSELPSSANITGAVLKLYGSSDASDDDFLITMVIPDISSPPIYSDYSNFGTASLGSLTTVGFVLAGINSITFNAAGLTYLNSMIQTGEVEIGLLSSKDISQTAPTQDEYVFVAGQGNSNRPVLELTYSDWPNEVYPAVPNFPDVGKVDLGMYGCISNYLTGLDTEISGMTDGDGNIDLAVANYITWDGTSEKIAYDNGNSRVTMTTLHSTSVVTVDGDLTTDDLTIKTITGTGTAVNATVAGKAELSNLAYLTSGDSIVDNELVFSAIAAPVTSDLTANIYMDTATGDLMLAIRTIVGGLKTDTWADFSAI